MFRLVLLVCVGVFSLFAYNSFGGKANKRSEAVAVTGRDWRDNGPQVNLSIMIVTVVDREDRW